MAGGRPATLILKIIADALNAQKGLGDTASAVGRVESSVSGLAGPAAIAGGAIVLLGTQTSAAASDVEQSFGAVESVFKDTADATKDLAREAGRANGLATADYAQMAAVLGAQLKGMGTSADELSGQTDKLIDIGSDLAATFGGDTASAVEAVSSLLRGERDPIEKYGVSIKEADVAAQKAAMGLSGLTGEADKQATATATLALLTAQTADAQGAFARETDTAAHAQQVAAAEAENASASLGTALLPVVVALSTAMAGLAGFVQDNTTLVQALVAVIAVLAGGILAANVALKAFHAAQLLIQVATKAWTAIQWLLNVALSANPIGIVVALIAALVAGIILAYNNSETFRNIVQTVFKAVTAAVTTAVDVITRVFGTLLAILSAPFNLWLGVVRRVVDTVMGLFRGLADFIGDLFDRVKGLIDTIGKIKLPSLPFTASAPAVAAAPAVLGRRGVGARSGSGIGGGPVTVNVYTTGDSMEAEQAVVRALRRANRLSAGVVSAPALGGAN